MLTVSEAAIAKFKEITEREDRQGHGLRVTVHNGGTFQPGFALNFVAPDEARDDDARRRGGRRRCAGGPGIGNRRNANRRAGRRHRRAGWRQPPGS